jgi:hypothetical protein
MKRWWRFYALIEQSIQQPAQANAATVSQEIFR